MARRRRRRPGVTGAAVRLHRPDDARQLHDQVLGRVDAPRDQRVVHRRHRAVERHDHGDADRRGAARHGHGDGGRRPGNATDWVALCATGGSTYVDWKYLNGATTAPAAGLTGATLSFAMPATPGTYVLKFWAGSTLLATSETITVGSPTITVSTDDGGPWRDRHRDGRERAGQSHRLDRHHVTGASAYLDWKYLNGTKTAPAGGGAARPSPSRCRRRRAATR